MTQPWTQAARCQSITRAIHACCSGSRRRAYGDQPRLRSAIDTSAASALSGTVKPALRRPFGVSTNTRRRRCGIRLTIANGRVNGCERPPVRDKPSDGMGAGAGLARATILHVGRPDYFPRVRGPQRKRSTRHMQDQAPLHANDGRQCPLLAWRWNYAVHTKERQRNDQIKNAVADQHRFGEHCPSPWARY
jgi:hypothetical protein